MKGLFGAEILDKDKIKKYNESNELFNKALGDLLLAFFESFYAINQFPYIAYKKSTLKDYFLAYIIGNWYSLFRKKFEEFAKLNNYDIEMVKKNGVEFWRVKKKDD